MAISWVILLDLDGCPVGFLELDLGIVMRECKEGEDDHWRGWYWRSEKFFILLRFIILSIPFQPKIRILHSSSPILQIYPLVN